MIKMKESRIPWIGLIPEHWEMVRVKNIFNNHKNIVGEKENEFERLALTLNGVIKRDKNDSKGLQSENLSTYQILNENELVFKMIDLANVNTSRVGYSPYTGIVSPVYIILNNNNYSRYGYYYFYSMWQREIFNKLGNDGVRSALNASDMLNLPFPNISVQEANIISKFLDEKTKEIDNAIKKTKTTIEDYKKLKEKVITDAVTKGLNKTFNMKNSNVDWIGYIPTTSYITRLKYLVEAIKDGTHGTHERVNEGKYLLSAKNIDNGRILITDKESFISEEDYKKIVSNGFPKKNDILMCCVGDVGKTAIYDCDYPIAFQRSVMFIRIKSNFNYKYINYYLMSSGAKIEEMLLVNKNIQAGLYQGAVGELRIVCHEPQVEKDIVNYLDNKCNEIDNLIKSKEKIVEELENYKKSVIYEYVTGKKEVK